MCARWSSAAAQGTAWVGKHLQTVLVDSYGRCAVTFLPVFALLAACSACWGMQGADAEATECVQI